MCLPLGLLEARTEKARGGGNGYTLEKQVRKRMNAPSLDRGAEQRARAARGPRVRQPRLLGRCHSLATQDALPRPLTYACGRPSASLEVGSSRPLVTSNRGPLNGSQGPPQVADWAPAR